MDSAHSSRPHERRTGGARAPAPEPRPGSPAGFTEARDPGPGPARVRPPAAREPAVVTPILPLTTREREVAAALAGGRTNEEICADLHLSLSTVKNHISSALSRLGLRNRVELALVLHGIPRSTETGRFLPRRGSEHPGAVGIPGAVSAPGEAAAAGDAAGAAGPGHAHPFGPGR